MSIIFDLDQTLIDSSCAIELRRQRRWADVYNLIPQFKVYNGLNDFIKKLLQNNIPICIVTSSPASYCNKVIKYFGWEGVMTVCYHDTKNHKPHPAPILKAIEKFNGKEEVLSVGDDIKDIQASNSAGVTSILVTWGINDRSINTDADFIFSEPTQLIEFIKEKYNIKS